MTGTILDYLIEYGDVPFAEMRLTEVDAAILCKLGYFHFENFVAGIDEGMPSVALKDIMLLENRDDLFEKGHYESVSRQMVELMLAGKRFKDLRVACFESCLDHETQTQFAAVTFITGPRRMFIVFRGTDSTIIGLKEDFNLLYMDKAKCHEYATDYLRKVSARYARKMYIGGHSKGGHLAVYASMNMPDDIKQRIHRIYSMDGLGLRPTLMQDGKFKSIEDRIYKLIPQSSLIGMMLDDDDRYEVIKASGLGLMQHNMYGWNVDGRKFIREKKLKTNAVFVEHTFNGWVDSQDDENRQKFIDGIYSLIDACKAESMRELISDGGKKFSIIIDSVKELDDESKAQLKQVFAAFIPVAKAYFKADVGKKLVRAGKNALLTPYKAGKNALLKVMEN